jgi:hypothetical protein
MRARSPGRPPIPPVGIPANERRAISDEGKMSIAAKISGNKELNLIELEDYASQPVRLLGVRSDRRPT